MKKSMILFAVIFCLLTLFGQAGFAAIYKYTDKDGQICLADDLQSIPEKFRSTAVIVLGESKDEEAESPKRVPVDKELTQPLPSVALPDQAPLLPSPVLKPQVKAPKPLSYRLMISGAASLGLLVIFLVISNQSPFKDDKKALSFIRTALIGIVSLFLVVAHVHDLMHLFGATTKAIHDVQQRQAEKGKKAAQTMKKINDLVEDTHKMEESLKAGSGEGDEQK